MKTGTKRVCPQGHIFYKSSDCPTCPVCEKTKANVGIFASLSSPARRALLNADIRSLKQLAKHREKEILELHGFGPSSLPVLRKLLRKVGMEFKK